MNLQHYLMLLDNLISKLKIKNKMIKLNLVCLKKM